MCKFCNIGIGDSEVIEIKDFESELALTVLNRRMVNRTLITFIENDADDYRITTSKFNCAGADDEISISIEYCPFCGRKLHKSPND